MRPLLVLLGLWLGTAFAAPLHGTGHPNWPPFSWQSGDRIIGIGAELAELLCRDLGLELELRPSGNWKRVQAQAEAGTIDLIVAAYRTPERETYLRYPRTAYLDDANVVWVARGHAFPLTRLDDLIGKRGTAMLGESYGPAFDRYAREHLNIEWVSTAEQSLQKLVLGRADYYPFSRYGGEIQQHQLGLDGRVEALPYVLSTEGVYLAISRKSPLAAHLPQLEAALARRHADGSIDALLKKYMALATQR